MKTTYLFRNWMMFGALLYIAEASSVMYVYYQEGSIVLLECQSDIRITDWWGPGDFLIAREISVIDMHGHHKNWTISLYSQETSINPFLPHRNRLQVIRRIQGGNFFQINNASIFDEGLYFCQEYFMEEHSNYYLLKLINASRIIYKYYPERSTVLLKCSLNMEWFGPAYSNNSFNQSPANAMHEKRSIWTVNPYTEGKSISPSLPHHNRLKVIISQQTGDYELQIRNASLLDEGLYFCDDSEMPTVPDYYILQLINKPQVSIKKDLIENVKEGETKKLCCCIESYQSPTVTRWLKGSQEIKVAYNVTDVCYTINNISRYDQGIYTCTAENIVGNGSSSTILQVKYKPLVSSMQDSIEEINEGETKKLCCFVDSNPTPTSTRWFNRSQEILVTHNVNTTYYTIKSVNRYDQGNYTCTAENILGIGSVTIFLVVNYKPVVSRKHDLFEEINEGETKNLCCYVDSNTVITSTRWLNGSQEIFITHNVTETSSPTSTRWFKGGQEISLNATEICYTIKNVSRYDQGIYTCTAENIVGSGSITTVLQVKSNYQLEENAQPLQSVVLGGLLGTIAVLVVGIAILFFHMKQKKKQRILSTINLGSQRGNDDESGHYMEIYMIDESIVTPSQENIRPIIATVERSIVQTRDIAPISAGHSSTSSDNDRNAQVYLEDGYEHPYNTLLANNRDEDEHVYRTTKKTSSNENSTPSDNAACGCSFELTEHNSSPDQAKTHCEENGGDKNNESEI